MIDQFVPNVIEYGKDMIVAFKETVIMVLISGAIGLLAGLILAVILVITRENGLYENKILHRILETIINIFRSIPFVILVAMLVSFTRLLMGTSIGIKGALVPMVIGIVPFISRLVEQALLEVDKGVIEEVRKTNGYITGDLHNIELGINENRLDIDRSKIKRFDSSLIKR